MHLCVCYYPEHWPEDRWALDAAQMVETGLTHVRIGEFAWSRLEPRPGALTFDWMDRAIKTLAAAGLKIVLGTPTPTPPRWVLTKHPDMLPVDAEGRPRGFGSRRHVDFSHPGYLAEAERITSLVAERWGRHPAVSHIQIDNEYGVHDSVISYSDAARVAFRRWLAGRYGSAQALNDAWGNVFWSMDYGSFDEVDLPNLTVTEPNPAHVLAFRRFSSDQVVAWNRAMVAAIRAHSDRPLIHNYMGRETAFDHWDVAADLDVASWDAYPLGMLEDRVPATESHRLAYMRQGDPDWQAFHHDLYRAVGRGRWWIMELQPGPVNWAPHNPAPLPGMVRAWALEAFGHGAECVSWFRWRQAPFGQEQMHAGLLRPDGQPAPALAEARATADALALLAAEDTAPRQGDVALAVDYPSLWAWETQPQGDFNGFDLVFEAYRALRRRGLSVDIVGPTTETLAGYRAVLMPGLNWTAAWRRLAATADRLLLGPRTGAKTEEFWIPERLPPDANGLDIIVSYVESLRPGGGAGIEGGGRVLRWREAVEGTADTVLRLEDGAPLLLRQGGAHYLAGWPDPRGWDRILDVVAPRERSDAPKPPEGVRVRRLGALEMWVNYGASPADLGNLTGGSEWVLGGPTLPPAGVSVRRQ